MKQKLDPFYDGISYVDRGMKLGKRYEFDRPGINVFLWTHLNGSHSVTIENAYEYEDVVGSDEHYEDDWTCFERLMKSYVPHKFISKKTYEKICYKIMAGDLFGKVMNELEKL